MKKKLICTLLALTLALPCALAETVAQAAQGARTYDALYAGVRPAYSALDGVLGATAGHGWSLVAEGRDRRSAVLTGGDAGLHPKRTRQAACRRRSCPGI